MRLLVALRLRRPGLGLTMTEEQVIAELLRRGVELNVWACGCCGGATTEVKLDGQLVKDEGGYALNIGEPSFAK